MQGLEFASPRSLWIALVLIPLAGWAWLEHRRRASLRFSAASTAWSGGRGWRPRLLWAPPLAALLSLGLAIVAIARPQERNSREENLSVEGIDIVIALDLSTSMEAEDFRPNNRLFVAKQVLSDFITERRNDRIGLVAFAGQAFTQSPLTFDHQALKTLVDQLKTRILVDGTAIGDAIAQSVNRLRDSDAKSRVVVLITDGDNNAGRISPLDAAKAAKALGIPVFAILVGKGGKVRFPIGRDAFGAPVYRDLDISVNPELLQTVASLTGGGFYRATDPASLKAGLTQVLDSLARTTLLEGGASATYRERFQPFLLASAILLAFALFANATALRVGP